MTMALEMARDEVTIQHAVDVELIVRDERDKLVYIATLGLTGKWNTWGAG